MRRSLAIAACLVWYSRSILAQPETEPLLRFFRFEDPSPFGCLLTYFPPFFIQHELELKSFVREKSFRAIRKNFGDRRAVDALYVRAMQLTENNTAISLLLSALACLEHRTVGLKVPVFNLFFPLTNESEGEFERRVRNLPSKLYEDSPKDLFGDRDKLQHFFGSAFLAFVFESRGPAERFGEFVERGEDAFIVGGLLDDRDKRANHQGQRFGLALLDDNHRLPSRFLKPLPVIVGQSKCVGVW